MLPSLKPTAALLFGVLLTHTHCFAQVKEISDHTLPGSSVKTYHVKCENRRLGMVRFEPEAKPVQMCSIVQDGSKPEFCVTTDTANLVRVLNASAVEICK